MKIDFVMKLGGSLLYDLNKAKVALSRIEKSPNHNVVYTIGSGYMGESYKTWAKTENNIVTPFENSIRIWSNIQSINANIIASLNSSFVVCHSEEMIQEIISKNKRPIIDASSFHDYFKDLKYQTTDVRSAYICYRLGCNNLVIVTDVNGIYSQDPKHNPDAKKMSKINARELMNMGRTSVDKGLAEMLLKYNITGHVIGVDAIVEEQNVSQGNMEASGTVIEV